ncbi:MAG: ABC transporter substrate-binding protein [Halanaerobiales bacterium]
MISGKNFLFVSIVLVILLIAVTGCEREQEEEKARVDIFQFKVEAKEALENAADKYMEENTDVEISIQTVGGGDDYGAALRSKFAAGEEPAIFNLGGRQDVLDYQDRLTDLSEEPWVDQAFKGTLDTVIMDGKIYGLPFNQEGYGFIYNRRILEEAGIEPESINSYKALVAAVETLDASKEELGIRAVYGFPAKETWVTGLHLSNVAFANEFSNIVEAFNAESIEFKYAEQLKKMLDLQADYGYKPDGTKGSLNAVDYSTQVEELFSLEQVALIQQGNWAYGSIAGVDEEVAKNIGLLPMPLEGVIEDSIPVGIPQYWVVNKKAGERDAEAAKEFLNWLYSSEQGKEMIIDDFNFIPVLKGYEGEDLQPADPLARDILDYSNRGKTMPWVFNGYPVGWGMDVLGADIQAYLSGDMTWEEVVENAIARWAELR